MDDPRHCDGTRRDIFAPERTRDIKPGCVAAWSLLALLFKKCGAAISSSRLRTVVEFGWLANTKKGSDPEDRSPFEHPD